ncbi:PEP-CTERM sorting domain-containing protein [Desulfosediminicola flagellatus]|uniref:PEP-CTERM sorting domain-containing protein n=1 Tax=Desulfosediminicola flagellatus TaxID=2569541 RepID=UPI0010AD4530|nr:PEP-CTERM sorting domain-containing protein [Desulfosediminicola flagellatus]
MKKLLITWCMAITLGMTLTTDNSLATTLLVDDEGMLLGATHVLVDELFFNVTFNYGSFLDLYVGTGGTVNDLFDFDSSRLAALALLDQVLIDEGQYLFDSNPGPGLAGRYHIYTPQFLYEGDGEYVYAWITKNSPATDEEEFPDHIYAYCTMVDTPNTWAVWEKSPQVPEPTTIILFASGLFGLISTRLRKKK